MNKLMKFFKGEEGLETVEYAIILGLVVGGTIVLVIALGDWVQNQFSDTLSEVVENTGT